MAISGFGKVLALLPDAELGKNPAQRWLEEYNEGRSIQQIIAAAIQDAEIKDLEFSKQPCYY